MVRRLFEFARSCPLFGKGVFILFFIFFTPYSWCQQSICFGNVKNYGVDRNENLGLGTLGSVYSWVVRDPRFVGKLLRTYIDRTNEIIVDWGNTPVGNYVLEVNEINNGCASLNQMLTVIILPLPIINLTDQYICVDPMTNELIRSALIDTKLYNTLYSFKWELNGVALPNAYSSITVAKIGSYAVEVANLSTGCITSDVVLVKPSSSSVAIVKVENLFMDIQNIVITIIKGIGNYEYSIDGVDFQDSPVFSVSKSGVYPVVIHDKNGCNDMYLAANVIGYHKFFTPNGDSYNDIWKVDDLLPSMNSRVCVFDRYGKLLKSKNVSEEGWDGNYNGRPMVADDYWFTIEYVNSDGIASVFKSHFALIR
jgi:gliding motility-associated-like protein